MFLTLLRFEVGYQTRQPLFRVASAIFLLVGLVFARMPAAGGILRDAPLHLAFLVSLLSLGSLIPAALFTGAAALRDRELRMEAILFTTNLTHAQYLVGRFAGLVAATAATMALAVAGLYLGKFLPGLPAALYPSASPLPYLWAFLVFGLPNLLLGCALIFSTAVLSGSSVATYLSGVFLYVCYWVGSIAGNSPLIAGAELDGDGAGLAALLEPFGLVALLDGSRAWSVAEKNAGYLPLAGSLLTNRLLWLAFALGTFALAYRFFAFRTFRAGAGPAALATSASAPPALFSAEVRAVPAPAGWRRTLRGLLAATALPVRTLFRGYPFYALLVLWTALIVLSVPDAFLGDLRVPLEPRTALLLPDLVELLLKLGTLVVIFYAAELGWLDRGHRMEPLVDTTPTGSGVFFAARLGALLALIATLVGLTIVLAGASQVLLAGAETFDLALYASLFGRAALPLACLGALALAIQSFFANKYVGMGATFAVVLPFSAMVLTTPLAFEHPLLRFGYTPPTVYSAMAGGGYHDAALPLYLAYAVGLAGLACAAALAGWRRGMDRRGEQLRLAGVLALVALLLAGGAGRAIHGELDGHYRSSAETRDWQEGYERSYAAFADLPAPTTVGVDLALDLFPDERRYSLRGTLRLENQTAAPLDRLLVALDPRVSQRGVDLAGAAPEADFDRYGQRWYRFAEPLAPGAFTTLDFEVEVERPAFAPLDPENYVLPAASYVEIDKLFPAFGFRPDWRLDEPAERERRGLPPLAPAQTGNELARDRAEYHAVISTSRGQTVVGPGQRVETWDQGNRTFHRFRAARPLPARYGIASAVYTRSERRAGGVDLAVFATAADADNAAPILDAAAAAIEVYQRSFGPYPDDYLEIAEIPSFSDLFAATAYPNAIFAVENRTFLQRQGSRLDLRTRGIAHEVAHQYWSRLLTPREGPGARLLTETLAEYSAALAHETLDPASRYDYQDTYQSIYVYLRGYGPAAEAPLVAVEDEPHVYYFKGAHAMHVMRELLGERAVDGVLAGLLRDFPYPARPAPQVLVERLRAAAPAELAPKVDELFREVVTYRLDLRAARRVAEGRAVELDVVATRIAQDEAGAPAERPLAGVVEVGLWAGDRQVGRRAVLLRGLAAETLRLEVDAEVDRVELDPRRLLLVGDRSRLARSIH